MALPDYEIDEDRKKLKLLLPLKRDYGNEMTKELSGQPDSPSPPDFEKLVADLYVPLYRFALALARNEADAVDLTQQTFYRWATKGHQLRDGAKAQSWLFSCLYREFLAQKRHSRRFVDSEEVPEPSQAEPRTAASVIDQLDGAIAQRALLALEEHYRAPLVLFYLKRHSYTEIAGILEIPIGTVMSRLARGKAKLRESLADPRRIKRSGP